MKISLETNNMASKNCFSVDKQSSSEYNKKEVNNVNDVEALSGNKDSFESSSFLKTDIGFTLEFVIMKM